MEHGTLWLNRQALSAGGSLLLGHLLLQLQRTLGLGLGPPGKSWVASLKVRPAATIIVGI